jgi:transposase-like protein
MDVLRVDLSDEGACYAKLLELLHPNGLTCPRCRARDGLGVHRRRRSPVLDYQCAACGRVFNAWTGTPLEKTHRRPSHILKILRGILLKTPTAQLARELQCQRAQLLALRRRLEPLARALAEAAGSAEVPPTRRPGGEGRGAPLLGGTDGSGRPGTLLTPPGRRAEAGGPEGEPGGDPPRLS